MSIKQAFNNCAKDYDLTRKQLIPCFDDFYGTALEIIKAQPKVAKIKVLDLGAGTGLLSSLVAQIYPHAEFVLYDISESMLEEAKKRFSTSGVKADYVVKDYSGEPIDGTFDLIISALSIHHLEDTDKETLFKRLFVKLNNNGLFVNADQVLGETPSMDTFYRSSWLKQVREKGVTDITLSSALERMKEDKMSTLANQMNWLRKANFSEVNCWYKNFSFVVYSGAKLTTSP